MHLSDALSVPFSRSCRLLLGLTLAAGLGAGLLTGGALPAQAQAERPASFADLVDQISDAVVNITTTTTVAQTGNGGPVFPDGSPFEDFFRDFNGPNGPQRPRQSQALGSGFVISADGYIVTNNHVIDGADEISIEFFSGAKLDAKVIGIDKTTDIALLKVQSDKPLPFVSFGDSDAMRVGDWVLAMGNPLGQGFSVSAGIVSAKARALQGQYDDYLQTDAAINRGNSGGPLFDMAGEVIGVNTAILSPNGGSIGIGFAMSSAVVSKVVDQLKEFGETRRGWLGVRIQDVDQALADAIGLAKPEGALVTEVPEGPARDAGIKQGDVILSFDGTEVEDTRHLVREVGNTAVGKAVDVVVFRDGARQTLQITLGRRETADSSEDTPETPVAPVPEARDVLGMTLSVIDDSLRQQRGLTPDTTGLVIGKIDETSDAYAKGLREGDLITEAGQKPLTSVKDLTDRVDEAKEAGRKSLLVLVRQGDNPRFIALSVE